MYYYCHNPALLYYPAFWRYPTYAARPEFPEVDTNTFEHSVAAFQKITHESSILLSKFTDRQFARNLMTAAQENNQSEVDRLIHSIGISSPVKVKYTPSGLFVALSADAQDTQCCTLEMYLKWGM